MLRLGNACSNEMGTFRDGQLGDQTGREVRIDDFYEYDWDYFFRANDPKLAEAIAQDMIDICNNNNVGYGQGSNERYTLYLQCQENGYDFKHISRVCATDCSQVESTILRKHGLNTSIYMYTGNALGEIEKTNAFVTHKYLDKSQLKKGDILLTVRKGHMATVVEEDANKPFVPSKTPMWVGECYGEKLVPVYGDVDKKTRCSYPTLGAGNLFDVCDDVGDYYYIRIVNQHYGYIEKKYVLRKTPSRKATVNTPLRLRMNPGTNFITLCTMPKGSVIDICDMKRGNNNADWYYVIYNGNYGFCASHYVS